MEYRIKDLVIVRRGSSPRPIMTYLSVSGYKWLKISDFKFGDKYVSNTKEFINKEGLSGTKLIKSGTLILTNSASPGIPVILKSDMCLHDGFLYFENRDFNKLNIDYLYYWFMNNRVNIVNQANGSVFRNLKKEIVENLEISIPSLKKQNKIVKLLSDIDKKNEVNNKINENLQNLSQELYKRWFVEFDFPNENGEPYRSSGDKMVESELGEIPKGWKVVEISGIANCVLGGTPSRDKPEYWQGNISWINSGKTNEFRILDPTEYITELGLKKSSTALLPKRTTVIAITGATLGQISLLEIDACANQSVIGLIEKEKGISEFIYLLINDNISEMIKRQTGGAQQHINKNDVESYKVLYPNKEVLKAFNEVVFPFFEKIGNNCLENINLKKLKETLLPKLMNGEIDLDKIEI